MHETLLMMKSITTDECDSMELEELAERYKENLYPSIFASAFVKLYFLIYKVGKKYEESINWDDLVSYALEMLDISLQTYDKCSNVKFATYFLMCYERKLIALYNKSKKLSVPPVDNTSVDDYWSVGKVDEYNFNTDIIKQLKLTEREGKYCYLAYLGYTAIEIAKILNMSRENVYLIRNKIKKRYNSLQMQINLV